MLVRLIGVTALAVCGRCVTGQVVLSEFLVDPDGTDAGREWVELFNAGSAMIDLDGWTLGDAGGDLVRLPARVMMPGDYAIVVSGGIGLLDGMTAKLVFEAEWLAGRSHGAVIGIDDFAFGNAADELILRDDRGATVWSLAYGDDDGPTFATFYTETHDYSVRHYGTPKEPGVIRNGFDNGTDGFLGYEQNNFTVDREAFFSDISKLETLFGDLYANVGVASVGSPLRGMYRPTTGDQDGDGAVGILDLLLLLGAWGPCPDPCPPACFADLDADCTVGIGDLLILLGNWTV